MDFGRVTGRERQLIGPAEPDGMPERLGRWRWFTSLVALIAAVGAGCISHQPEHPSRNVAPLPECFRQEIASLTGTNGVSPPPRTASSEQKRGARYYDAYEVTVTNVTAVTNGSVEFDYFVPTNRRTDYSAGVNGVQPLQKIPAILILPIMGGTSYDLESYFARSFAKRGFASAILHRPNIKKEVQELDDIDVMLRKSVRDAEWVIDWLVMQPAIDTNRLGLFGVSLGAIRGTLVLALDPRLRAGVLGLVGGDLPYILTHTSERGIVRERDKVLQRLSLNEVEVKLRELITCEPLTVAPAIDPSRVLMVIAAFDSVIPARKGWELRRKLGNPAAVQLFSGHYSSVIYAPWLRWRTGRFFEQKFRE